MNPKALNQVEAFFRYLETERRVSPHTIAAYRLDLPALISFCDADEQLVNKWSALKPAHVRAFGARPHAVGLSPASVQRRLSTVRSLCTFLRGDGIIRDNPAEGIPGPKIGKHLPGAPTVDQMAQLLDIPADDDPLTARDRAIMELAYSSGLRVAELTGLDCDSLDLKDGMGRVLGKGNAVRIVPVGGCAVNAIRSWLPLRRKMAARSQTAALFVGRNGERLTPRNVQLRVKNWATRQRIKARVFPHMFRHYVLGPTTFQCGSQCFEFPGNVALYGMRSGSITRHSFRSSEVLQEGEQAIIWAVPTQPALMRSHFRERLFFHRECGVEVDLRGLYMLMAEPQRNSRSIDALLE